MRIQHNIAAMNAYRNYNINTSAVNKNLEKLSSGYKINRAGDDAAGLAISEKMRAQITGLDAASKNVKDGISLVKTAEGAMQEVQDMLNRMVYLATQSANGTYDNEVDRMNLQKEVDQLQSEINRIADSANFNGIKLLDGSLDASVKTADVASVDVTPTADGQLGKDSQAGIYSIDLSNVSITSSAAGQNVKLTVWDQELTVNIGKDETLSGSELAKKLADEWNKGVANTDKWKTDYGFTMNASVEGDKLVFTMSNAPKAEWADADAVVGTNATCNFEYSDTDLVTGNNAQEVTVTVEQEAIDSTKGRMYGEATFELATAAGAGKVVVADGRTVTIGNETYVFAVGADSKYKGLDNVVDLTDKTATATDLIKTAAQRLSTAAKDNTSFKVGTTLTTGVISITEKEGGVDYSKNNLAGDDGKGSHGIGGTPTATKKHWNGLVTSGKVDPSVLTKGLTLQIGDTSESYNQLKVSVGDIHTKALGIDKISIATQAGAAAAVDSIKNAINQVSSIRGTLGATQNRLEHTQNNLSVMKENIQDAESTIRDTDVAEEMMAYTKNNILVQSAQAMLAQANQIPQGVLQLLG